jgi:Mycobacterium membrane protein
LTIREHLPGTVAKLVRSSRDGRWHGQWDWVHRPFSYTPTLWMKESLPGSTSGTIQLAVRVVWRDADTGRIRDRGTFRDSLTLAGDCESPPPPPPPTLPAVRYEVAGSTTSVDVTYNNSNDDVAQANGVPVPWTYTFTATSGFFLYVSAQKDGSTGAVTCSIYVNNVLREANTSTGPYSICTASGSL